MSPAATLPESLDLTYHVAKRVRTATPSAMKAYGRLMGRPGMLSLAGGVPHSDLFPVKSIQYTIPSAESLIANDIAAWTLGEAQTATLSFTKIGVGNEEKPQPGSIPVNRSFQYGLSNGEAELVRQLEEYNALVHGKAYSDQSVVITAGCTDGCSKVFSLLVEPDVDTVLCEEFTFSSSVANGQAKGAKFFPIKMDDKGLIPAELERVLSSWDATQQGKKPHLLYTIPCGQNPTGTVQPTERYDEIYAIAQRHDLIIMEDDPYFPLQLQPYTSDKEARSAAVQAARDALPRPSPSHENAKEVAQAFNDFAGVRSYLSRDVDGRVVRVDTFSKVAGPGLRLGWVTANEAFAERLLRIGESSTQVPNGLSQSLISAYLSPHNWGLDGWLRWVHSLRLEYQRKRDVFLDALAASTPTAHVSTTPAQAGMFQWLNVHVESHSRYDGSNAALLLNELVQKLVENNVLLMPAAVFSVPEPGVDNSEELHFLRATFAGNTETIEAALKIFGRVVTDFFEKA